MEIRIARFNFYFLRNISIKVFSWLRKWAQHSKRCPKCLSIDRFGEYKPNFLTVYDKIMGVYFPDKTKCIKIKWFDLSDEEMDMINSVASLHQIAVGGGDGSMAYLYCAKCNIWHRLWDL